MPSEASHIDLAVRNQAALDYLSADPAAYCEWIATVAFYKALHVVEAVLTHDRDVGHGQSHTHRSQVLKQTSYSHIWKHYRPLWAASMVARYLKDIGGRDFQSFTDYLAPEDVIPQLVNHYLKQVEKSAGKRLSQRAMRALGLPPPARPRKPRRRRRT